MAQVSEGVSDEGRPADVDTGFWLWLIAVPLMVAGYLVDLVSPQRPQPLLEDRVEGYSFLGGESFGPFQGRQCGG